jgi:hypothetical protein
MVSYAHEVADVEWTQTGSASITRWALSGRRKRESDKEKLFDSCKEKKKL